MGFIDKVKGLFGMETDEQKQVREEEARKEQLEKSGLATSVKNLADKLNRVNSFDNDTKYARMNSRELENMSIEDLRKIQQNLSQKVGHYEAKRNKYNEALAEASWTGKKLDGMSDHDLDRYQREDR